MKILYITKNTRNEQFPWLIDYQDDSLLVGLKEHFGNDVVDVNRKHNIYTDYSDSDVKTEYGRGFTYTRLLEDGNVDRDDIHKKIRNHYFDLVVYGNVWRSLEHHDLVLQNYEHAEIAYIDGEDNTKMHPVIKEKGMYFKRELIFENNQEFQEHLWKVCPISFAFPTMKIMHDTPKEQKLAFIDPRNKSTYVYDSETPYYQDYQRSRYAWTLAKAGWDCARHYEIMGNGCVPLFLDVQNCPRYVMHRGPKALLSKIMFFYNYDNKWLEKNYDYLRSELLDHFVNFNTTSKLAKYFLKDIDYTKNGYKPSE
jgi:hypothetical protein